MRAIEVCICGHVIKDDNDRETHMAEHYDSYRVALKIRTAKAMDNIYPIPAVMAMNERR